MNIYDTINSCEYIDHEFIVLEVKMSRKIENPKVFISYAWGTKEYQHKVMGFAGELKLNGIDVVIDKVSALPGNDLNHFMESCVSDETITNVLILLDENYAIKADARVGGAGAETQIISSKIYNQVKQEKFIPVVFERDFEGNIFKPAYLTSISHFDLTIEDNYDIEFQRLIKTLCGAPIYVLPDLGNIPDWVDTPQFVSTKTSTKYSKLKMNLSEKIKVEQFQEYLLQIKKMFTNFYVDNLPIANNESEYITLYNETCEIRNEFLSLLKYSKFVEGSEHHITEFLESLYYEADRTSVIGDIQLTLVHEMFIYLIAYWYKIKNYEGIGYAFSKTYFDYSRIDDGGTSFLIFYSYNDSLERAMNKADGKQYLCGTAKLWIDNINLDTVNVNEFVFADTLCYQYSVLGEAYIGSDYWFPITYVYGGLEKRNLKLFAIKLKSEEHLNDAIKIFGYKDSSTFKERLTEVEKQFNEGAYSKIRYQSAFGSAPLIFSYVKSVDIGKLK